MTQQEFNELSKRYLNNEATAEEFVFLEEWLQNHNENEFQNKFSNKEIEKRIWKNISKSMLPVSYFTKKLWISGIAASIFLFFLLTNIGDIKDDVASLTTFSKISHKGKKISNTGSKEQKIKLDDGTIVFLKQNGSITYAKEFNIKKREIFLEGEAFFNVKHDVTRPFIVHSGSLVAEVLGTSFRIKPQKNQNDIEVSVATGKVSVYAEKSMKNNEKAGIVLTPNQQIVFQEESQKITSSIVADPVPILVNKISPSLIFSDETLENILMSFSEIYGIDFEITNPRAKKCRITADLTGLPLFVQLELLCKSVDANYEKRGTVIFINGDGCQ